MTSPILNKPNIQGEVKIMRPDIVIPAPLWDNLQQHLIRATTVNLHPVEEYAYLLASCNLSPFGLRLIVREIIPASPSDFTYQSTGKLRLRPEFMERAIERCGEEGWSLIEVHSHPSDTSGYTTFSDIDQQNDEATMPPLTWLMDNTFTYATMVVGQGSLDAHLYNSIAKTIVPIEKLTIVGANQGRALYDIPTTSSRLRTSKRITQPLIERYQRQELFFGKKTQDALAKAIIAIVGLGGLGSFVALELAHLGVGHLILIDPDIVEETNLNRLLGVGIEDVGQVKVAVFEKLIERMNPHVRVSALPLSLLTEEAVNYAKGADILVGCVDNNGTRIILNQIAVRYLIPLIDGGTGIRVTGEKRNRFVGGQVQVVLPGFGCLECAGGINRRQANIDLGEQEQREEGRKHNYDTGEIAPSVISLNGVIASLQVTEVLNIFTDQDTKRETLPLIMYNALAKEVSEVEFSFEDCPSCGIDGWVGFGDTAPVRFFSGTLIT